MVALVAAQVFALHTFLFAIVGAAQIAHAGEIGSDPVICLTHDDASAPAPSDRSDEHSACLTHCVLCAGSAHVALPAHGVSVRTARLVGAATRWPATATAASRPPERSSTSPRGPPLAA